MIVQTAPANEPRFVIKMAEHTAFAGALARAFGNDRFEAVSPLDEMLYVIDHHDHGWFDFDEAPGRDPETGLPWNLVGTPREILLETGKRSPAFNSRHSAYAGLLSSMHIWGLYNGRYGYSEQVLLNKIPGEFRADYDKMLDAQLSHQAALKEVLTADPETANWIEEGHLYQNYKQLQFFDTLALYFNCTGAAERKTADFTHVPMSATEDVTVTVTPVDADTYTFSPHPFCEPEVTVGFAGRYMTPTVDDRELSNAMADPTTEQQVRLVAR
jgi:hypothetical protein